MHKSSRLLLAAVVAGATMLTSLSAQAFWGPFSFMNWGGWGGPWSGYGWGYPGYGWGYPGYGYGYGYPGYGYGYGYPYGGWGAPYAYGWGVPYAYPTTVAAAPAAPATSSAK